jgi:hypothetical protein
MNDSLFFEGVPVPAIDPHVPVRLDQTFYEGVPFTWIWMLNTSPANFLIMFE